MNKIKAFTLAEVLITLAIIGIVAAVTIPSVIANYQQREFKTGLRKAVSVLNEAIQANIAIEGETPYDRYIGNRNDQYPGSLDKYLQKHMNIIKTSEGDYVGGYADSNGNYRYSLKNKAFYTADGMRFELERGNGPGGEAMLRYSNIVLHESGIKIGLMASNSHCGSYGLAKNPYNTEETPCVILVDVNGDKKPTVWSANTVFINEKGSFKENYIFPKVHDRRLTDIFLILITEDRAIPFGVVAQRAMYEK